MKKLAIAVVASLPLLAALGGCKEDEAPPPLPAPTPQPSATATDLVLVAEEPVIDAGVDAGTTKGKYTGKKASLGACCSALSQNAENAPEPTATYMKQAAATCQMLVGQGQGQAMIVSAVSAALKGAQLPAACK